MRKCLLLIFLTFSEAYLRADVTCSLANDSKFDENQFSFSNTGPTYGSSRASEKIKSYLSEEDFLRLTESKTKNDLGNFTINLIYDTEKKSIIYLLGETHIKRKAQKKLGQDIVSKFRVRALEGFQHESEMKCFSRARAFVVDLYTNSADIFLKANGFESSSVDDAYRAAIELSCKDWEVLKNLPNPTVAVPLECGELDKVPIGVCNLNPTPEESKKCEDFLLDRRNQRMAENTIRLMSSLPQNEPLLVIAGSHHIPGIAQIFANKNRYKIVSECWTSKAK